MKQDGRKNFIRMIEQISKGNNSEAVNIIAELGTMKAGGVLPDSYPEGSEPDDDYLVLSGIETAEGEGFIDLDRCRRTYCSWKGRRRWRRCRTIFFPRNTTMTRNI